MKFKYSNLLLCITFFFSITIAAQDTIIKSGHHWKYYDHEQHLSIDWYKDPRISEEWNSGPSPLGFNIPDVKTTINRIKSEPGEQVLSYYTTSFYLQDPLDVLVYELRLRRDDGAIVYFNGYELCRSNVDEGELSDKTHAHNDIYEGEETIYHNLLLPSENFRRGINTVAVVLYQRRGDSPDGIFDLELVEHREAEIIPELMKYMDNETTLLNLKLKEINFKETISELETDKDLLTQSNHFTVLIRNTFFVLLLVALIAIYLLYRHFKAKIGILKESNNLLSTEKNNLQQEILNNSLYNLKSSQYFESLRDDLQRCLENRSLTSLKGIIENVKQKINNEEDWDNLELQFNLLNSDFIERLKQTYPLLTATELRHCIFIKSLIPTKEVASIMGIEVRTVQSAWYRIKKKLKLTPQQDLKSYLMNF